MLGFLWVSGNYNSLVTAENQVDKSWASVETQYQRRLDLVGNLVSSVKGAQKQEVEVFGKIAEARSRYLAASTPEEKVTAVNDIETNIALVPRLQEAYPDLKSNTQVTKLMDQLTGTENGIQAARDHFNDTANNYNTQIERFPKNLFAASFGFEQKELFKAKAGAENAPIVSF
jgi:LemA protein